MQEPNRTLLTKNRFYHYALILLIGFMLSGCVAATHTAISKHNLAASTHMTDSIFITPPTSEKNCIYVKVTNTTDKQEISLESKLKQSLIAKGYRITQFANQSDYMLQANVLQAGEISEQDLNSARISGYGGAIAGALLGSQGGWGGSLAGGLAGGLISVAADALVKDVTFSVIVDVRISEKREPGSLQMETKQSLDTGMNSKQTVVEKTDTQWMKYQTRIMSHANKVNLKLEEALPVIVDGVVNSLGGIFEPGGPNTMYIIPHQAFRGMYDGVLRVLQYEEHVTKSERNLLVVLSDVLEKRNDRCPTRKELGARIGVGASHVSKIVGKLKKKGLIEVLPPGPSGLHGYRSYNTYHLLYHNMYNPFMSMTEKQLEQRIKNHYWSAGEPFPDYLKTHDPSMK